MSFRLETERLVLRDWRDGDAEGLAELHADPVVTAELEGVLTREQSDEKLAWYLEMFDREGYTRWVVEVDGRFAGTCGIARHLDHDTIGPHVDIGWKLQRWAHGHGYATEAARAVLADAHARLGDEPVYAYTSPTNVASQRVMEKIGMMRRADLDFVEAGYGVDGDWTGLVWVSER
ncbi:MAG: GNAT family N-acetyltransferase [Actinomycetota bacterium]